MEEPGGYWAYLPYPALYKIFQHLTYKELICAGQVCKFWYEASRNDLLWKELFLKNFVLDRSIPVATGKTWYEEFNRLSYHIPVIQTETLLEHSDQVLHVSFSHNGKYFATCSKDGYVILWRSKYPAKIKYIRNMKHFKWKYTQYSQFNESDTLLLVSGVHFGTTHSTSGEIAVFNLSRFELQCRVVNKPYDIFGTWYSDQYLLSGDLHWLAHLVSTSHLWLNKASQEAESELVPITHCLFRFYNRNASSIRALVIANCLPNSENVDRDLESEREMSMDQGCSASAQHGNPISHNDIVWTPCDVRRAMASSVFESMKKDFPHPIWYNADYRKVESEVHSQNSDDEEMTDKEKPDDSDDDSSESSCETDTDRFVQTDKYLIFTTGYKTYTPHQIGFKRIKPFKFPNRMDPGPSLKERLILFEQRKEQSPPPDPDWLNFDEVADKFDKVDHLIDLHGHIVGMGLSPDQRYLYVNSRSWPENYVISNPLEPPPIAQEIDIHVIDLVTLKQVGKMLRAHKAFTPNNECFFIFLDVCNEYVASGAEDKHGYLWDRHYGACLVKFPHQDVVNSVAFNPKDPEMLVTTSDDHTIKVWRSRAKVSSLNLDESALLKGIELRSGKSCGNAKQFREMTTKSLRLNNDIYHFDIADYAVFASMLILSALTGLYFGCRGKYCKSETSQTLSEYLTGNKNLKPFPVALSLIASYVSGVTILGTPSEIYLFGTQYWFIVIAIWLSGLVVSTVYLPVFLKLQVNSSYEYLELRFNRAVRTMASVLFILDEIMFLPIIIYVPSLAFNQVTSIDIHIIGTIVGAVCVFYTYLGGLKAVVWTDSWQVIAMFISVVLVVILGTIQVGGPGTIIDLTSKGNRFEFFNFNPSLYERYTIFSVIIGGFTYWTCFNSVNQTMVQRYLSLPTVRQSKLSVLLFTIGVSFFVWLCCYAGVLVFSSYYDCDPLTLGRIKADDQILPLFVMETVGHLRGVPGLFIAGVFGAALSSLSVVLNSTAQVILEDFIKGCLRIRLNETTATVVVKGVVLLLGVVAVSFMYVVEHMGGVLAMASSLSAIAAGTTCGVFTLGMLFPWANSKGALCGAITGAIMSGVVTYGSQFVSAAKLVVARRLPVNVNETCFEKYGVSNNTLLPTIDYPDESNVFPLFRISFLWITPIGVLSVLSVGCLVSFLTGKTDVSTMDPELISPVMHWLLPSESQRYAGSAIKKARNIEISENETMVRVQNDGSLLELSVNT